MTVGTSIRIEYPQERGETQGTKVFLNDFEVPELLSVKLVHELNQPPALELRILAVGEVRINRMLLTSEPVRIAG